MIGKKHPGILPRVLLRLTGFVCTKNCWNIYMKCDIIIMLCKQNSISDMKDFGRVKGRNIRFMRNE